LSATDRKLIATNVTVAVVLCCRIYGYEALEFHRTTSGCISTQLGTYTEAIKAQLIKTIKYTDNENE
jgi:hypothetical protein